MTMKFTQVFCFAIVSLLMLANAANAQKSLDKVMPVRAFCIAAPKPANLERFLKFIREELPPNKINTLILRVDYNYQYESHPELRDSIALSKEEVKRLVSACRENNIQLIPQVNLLGHQSWASTTSSLLRVYPQFDETPHVQMPAVYKWPNEDSLYCKSYCPLHPEVHKIVFDVVDEICDAFESSAFHAGMDEVFYLGNDKCPRCSGKDKAELFAGEVNKIRDHLASKNRKLWIWGDRLIDGRTTGVGEWEGSFNNTHRAVDLVAKDVVICDWHYEKSVGTPVHFANRGLQVITCTWKKPAVAIAQTNDMIEFRDAAVKKHKKYYLGMMQTVWSNTETFLDEYYAAKMADKGDEISQGNCFKTLGAQLNNMAASGK